ncbi:MAG: glycosyltransferase [Candidatus Babeliales bacterium]|nr:glycosyltransferase [Candidatus Babeliales bacterium]
MNLIKKLISIILISLFFVENKSYDLTIVGQLDFIGSIARIPIGIIDCLKDDIKINFIPTSIYNLRNLPENIKEIIVNKDKSPGNVVLLTDINYLWLKGKHDKSIPNGLIKIAYSMLESSRIPQVWVNILNKLDAVVVPDHFLVDVYEKSGVTVPVFVLPLGMYMGDFYKKNKPKKINQNFIFGCSAGDWDRKNLDLVVDAFCQAFGKSSKVYLRIHSRFLDNKIKSKLKKINYKNIELIEEGLIQNKYIEFLSSLDCYVLLSKGEGFSITPRESLALGIPCIISNNTAHKTICDSGFVLGVKSQIEEPAFNNLFKQFCGYQYNCQLSDAVAALKEVYNNYQFYWAKAQKGKNWVKQYDWPNLKNKYLALLKPKKVILGKENIILNDCIITNSKDLYHKYMNIIS